MKKRISNIENYHPIILLVYFVGMAAVTMVTLNPIFIGISFFGAVLCTGLLTGLKKLLLSLAYILPIILIIALVNPFFAHEGETILFYLRDNPVTLESILYGATAAVMLASIFYWFKCFNIVMTSDKFVFLFGRVTPQLSLVLSMTLAFIPKLIKQYKRISSVQKSMGMFTSGKLKIMSRLRIISSLLGWALESSVETSDSMNARGYGMKGRTSYAIYRWSASDGFIVMFLALAFVIIAVCLALSPSVSFYPILSPADFSSISIIGYFAMLITAVLAAFVEIKENIKWRLLTSKI